MRQQPPDHQAAAAEQQIRALLKQEADAYAKGDAERVLACYAPDVVGYRSWATDPAICEVAAIGLDSLRAEYASRSRAMADWAAQHPGVDLQFVTEVIHVDVRDDRAVAVTRHWIRGRTAHESLVNEHQSIWMLARPAGQWRISGFVSNVTARQTVRRMPRD